MPTLTLREGLGRPLTYQEMDDNLRFVETKAQEAGSSAESAGLAAQFAEADRQHVDQQRQAVDAAAAAVDQAIANAGYVGTGPNGEVEDYAEGIEITARNQVIRADGEYWRISASVDLPYATSGDWAADSGDFVAMGDAVLRQELAGDVADGQGAIKVRGAVIYVDTIADLQALPTSELVDGQQVQVKEYHAGTGVGGGEFYWDAASTEAENGGSAFQVDGVATGRWKRIAPANKPEDWGAVGDGVADDTESVKAWWESEETSLVARRNYLISGTDALLRSVTGDDFYADLTNASFNISQARAFFLRVFVESAGRSVWVNGGTVRGNNNVARPIEIVSTVSAGTLSVKGFTAFDTFANSGLGFSSSAAGILVAGECSQVFVTGCRVSGVDRDYVNPGIVSSVGISVTDIVGSAHIENNVVLNIWSPTGDADADGISVFSRDRLLVGRQRVKIEISGNRVRDCKGRFIKLQTTKAHVWGNDFESSSGELITPFRAIDCQFGGCNIHDNFWNLSSAVTGMGDGVFVQLQIKEEGNWESQSVIRNNFVLLERELRYLVQVALEGGESHIEVADNYVKPNQSTDFLTNNLVRFGASSLTDTISCRLEVRDNTYPSNRDSIVQLVGPIFSGSSEAADKMSYVVTGNVNTRDPSLNSNSIIVVSDSDPVPHLRNIMVSGNKTGGMQRINAKSLDVLQLPSGNDFYYGTDGSTGGMLNAPSGYARFVAVKVSGAIELTRDDGRLAKRTLNFETWYEFTGTAL